MWLKNLFIREEKDKRYPDEIVYYPRWTNIIIFLITLFFVVGILFTGLNPFYVIKAGHRGVSLRFGSVNQVALGEGLHLLIPFIQATNVKQMNVQVQVMKTKADAASKDLQNVHSMIALNYHIIPDKVPYIYQTLGEYYWDTIITPQIQEAFKATTAHYNATELITDRSKVRTSAKEFLAERLKPYFIVVDDFAIIDFQFDKDFAKAIEDKQVAEIRIQTEKNNLEVVKTKAKQRMEDARGIADSMRLQQEKVTSELTKWEAVRKWDGKLPVVMSGAIPFFDIGNLSKEKK